MSKRQHLLLVACFTLTIFSSASDPLRLKDYASNAHWQQLQTPACQSFIDFSTKHTTEESGFLTDGLVVQKNNVVQFEFYDGDLNFGGNPETGLFLADSPHPLWSASKTVTATLLGIALTDRPDDISIRSKLDDFFPQEAIYGYRSLAQVLKERADDAYLQYPVPRKTRPNDLHYFDIRIENLVNMSASFNWIESPNEDIQKLSPLLMLYRKKGYRDMANFALNIPLANINSGDRWQYSSGNSVIISALLRELYGDEQYETLYWDLLFKPMGMKNTVVERDHSGTFIGSTNVFMRPLDMAKIGQLYLDEGYFNGDKILSDSWIANTYQITPSAHNLLTPLKVIKEDGVYGSRSFWLNRDLRSIPRQFPEAPTDMIFAAGHYGQLIIVLPSHDLVIARTGHDEDYWPHIGKLANLAISCFAKQSTEDLP